MGGDATAGQGGGSEGSIAVPGAVAFGFAGAVAFGFGAGFGARSYSASTAYKDLLEKFPEPPTPEAEALARSGATRALVAGTALAGLMGVGAVLFARANGVYTATDFADEIKKWLPSKSGLEEKMAPKIEPLKRSISASLQTARNSAEKQFKDSEMGRGLIAKAEQAANRPTEPWEKELVAKLEKEK